MAHIKRNTPFLCISDALFDISLLLTTTITNKLAIFALLFHRDYFNNMSSFIYGGSWLAGNFDSKKVPGVLCVPCLKKREREGGC